MNNAEDRTIIIIGVLIIMIISLLLYYQYIETPFDKCLDYCGSNIQYDEQEIRCIDKCNLILDMTEDKRCIDDYTTKLPYYTDKEEDRR